MLRKEVLRLGLPDDTGERLVAFANLLAIQNLYASRMDADVRCGQAEARYGQAEARYGQAEARVAQALERVVEAEQKASRLERLASKRYLELVELRGSVNLRDELKEILEEGAAALVAERRDNKQARPSALERWSYIFGQAARKDNGGTEGSLLDCCRAADDRLGSAERAAVAMVRIIENLDQRMHRSLPAEVIKRIGGIAIEESAVLGTQDCKLIECVMNWAAKPCQIVSQEEVEQMLDKIVGGFISQGTGDSPYDDADA